MSIDYTYITHAGGSVDTGTNNDVLYTIWSKNFDFLLVGLEAKVSTAGAQAAQGIEFYDVTNSAQLGLLTIGTAAQDTMHVARPGDSGFTVANAYVAAGTVVQVRHVTTDASGIYLWKAYWTITIV